jgi:hypothetical protein
MPSHAKPVDISDIDGVPPLVARKKRGYRARNLRARLVWRLIWATLSEGEAARPFFLDRPPTCPPRCSPSRRPSLPFPRFLVLQSHSSSSSFFPAHSLFLLPHCPHAVPYARRHPHAMCAPVPAEPTSPRACFDDKLVVVGLPLSRFDIFVSSAYRTCRRVFSYFPSVSYGRH